MIDFFTALGVVSFIGILILVIAPPIAELVSTLLHAHAVALSKGTQVYRETFKERMRHG